MFNLTQEEADLILKSTDPKLAAVALKLKEVEDRGEFIPKDRFSEVIKERRSLEERLKAFEEREKKDAEERARKNGELDKILEAEKVRNAELQKKIEEETAKLNEEKKTADQFRQYRQTVLDTVKKQLEPKGQWLPEYENFSLESLQKLPGVSVPKVGVDVTSPVVPGKDVFTREEVARMTKEEVAANLEKVNKSIATWKGK